MHKRVLCCHAVSVRLSVAFVYCVKTSEHIFKVYLPSGSHVASFFHTKLYDSIWQKPTCRIECRWSVNKIAVFDQYLALSRKWYKIGPSLLWNVNRNSCVINRLVPFLMTCQKFQWHKVLPVLSAATCCPVIFVFTLMCRYFLSIWVFVFHFIVIALFFENTTVATMI